jgi:DNA processing protein
LPRHPETILSGATLPARLADLPSPPDVLYVRGELPRGAAVGIVGTRYPSPQGKAYARAFARELAEAGVAILSGGALGIDAAAHRGALDAGGVTVVVAPSGWSRMTPERHRQLFRRAVRSGGAYVSLVASDVEASRASYFPRNALLVALAHVVVVIEAPFKSGARNTSATARRVGRPLFVCPAPPWSRTARGCLEELRLGARPLCSVRDVLRELAAQQIHPVAVSGPPASPRRQLQLSLRENQNQINSSTCSADAACALILETIRAGAAYPDELCARTGLPPQRLHELLLTLRLDGVLVCDASGRLTALKSLN